jgi:hypothetical protein
MKRILYIEAMSQIRGISDTKANLLEIIFKLRIYCGFL